jgi:hypothetical protein
LLNSEGEETRLGDEKEEDLGRCALILSIFRKMKLAEDEVDATKTEVSFLWVMYLQNQHFLTGMELFVHQSTRILCDIGIMIVKDLAGAEIPKYRDEDKIPVPVSIYKIPENAREENMVKKLETLDPQITLFAL